MATFDLGRVTPLYKGDYSASASYELNDVVLYNGNLYWHVQATATVGILPTDTTVWKLAFSDEGVRAEIRGYADDAQASADSALASKSAAATSASNASASASQAALSAQTASTKASEASASAQTATTKASEATVSAQSAASSAQTATDKATLASQKAAAASESASLATAKANAAATSETNAVTAAQTATTKASEAAASATSAQEYDESAQQSAVNAQTAQGLAETAQTAAETAQGLAEDARDLAQQYAESIDPENIYSAYPTDTASGSIVSFPDGADGIPLKSLVVDINPVQSGSGDPSPTNVRPITGWTGANVRRAGINIFDKTSVVQGVYIDDASGDEKAITGGVCSDYISVVPNATYYIKSDQTGGAWGAWYDADKNYISGIAGYVASASDSAKIKTAPSNAMYMRLTIARNGTGNVDTFSVNYPSTDHDYHAYTGTTYPITFPAEAGTVYGGHLDVLSGVLTVDRATDDMGNLEWKVEGSAGKCYSISKCNTIKKGTSAGGYDNAFAEIYSASNVSSMQILKANQMSVDGDGNIQLYDTRFAGMTRTQIQAELRGVTMCYKLAEPIEIQLTPTEVRSLLGQNNIFADTGDTSVEYRADTKMYIERLTEPDADMIADSNIVSGQYFMVGNILYKATANIASGGQVIEGTNAIRKSLSEALNEINQ